MNSSIIKKAIIVIYAFILWILCGAVIGIGRSVTSIELTLIIHAIAAPVFASLISRFYYKKYNYTSPISTAIVFMLFVMIMDAGLVAPVIEKSFDMFKSILGTWIPFLLIFISVYITGIFYNKRKEKLAWNKP
ncbi:MAG: hypothetical protein EHM58_08795 [Ignavibacteriae bacterium]|nr:MAG: hypothetical protein EHM58_08795 [Ignavibacteriota bacterium]